MSYTSLRFSLHMVVDDSQEVDLVSFTSAFEMNRIPKAMAVLPPGRQVRSMKVSTAHDLSNRVVTFVPAKVFARIRHQAGEGNDRALVPEGDYTLFDGHLTSLGYHVDARGRFSLVGELTHWLSALTFASCLSASSHPQNPAQFTFGATLKITGIGLGRTAPVLSYYKPTLAAGTIHESNLVQDLWGKGILPWFKALASTDMMHVADLPISKKDGPRQEIATALNRFSGDKLELDLKDAKEKTVARQIFNDISASTTDPGNTNVYGVMAHMTLWDKLVGELAPTYMFSVIPRVKDALVVPFIPGLRTDWNPRNEKYTFLLQDIASFDINRTLPRPLRAFGLFTGMHSATNSDLQPNNLPETLTIGGMFVARDSGMVIFKQTPRFLSELPWSTFSLKSSGLTKAKATAFHPDAGEAPADDKPKDILKNGITMLNNFAHALYANEVLKNRIGQLTGTVRFDVAPGSTVSLEGLTNKFIANVDHQERHATVLRVTSVFDAESAQAGCMYQLAHVRTGPENTDDETSVEKHPLYKNKWTGDHLVKPS